MDTIKLDAPMMDKLLSLCAHDFKHDFIEDKTRSARGFAQAGYDQVRSGGTRYIDNPYGFPLACYIYLIIETQPNIYQFNFKDFCNRLPAAAPGTDQPAVQPDVPLFAEAISASSFGLRSAPYTFKPGTAFSNVSNRKLSPSNEIKQSKLSRTRARRETENSTYHPSQVRGGEKRDAAGQVRQTAAAPARPRRAAAAAAESKLKALVADQDVVDDPSSDDNIKWDDQLHIYMEWLVMYYPDVYNKLIGIIYDSNGDYNTPRDASKDDAALITFLIPSSKWESVSGGDEGDRYIYKQWVDIMRGNDRDRSNDRKRQRMNEGTRGRVWKSNNFGEIINLQQRAAAASGRLDLALPPMGDIKIEPTNWNKFKVFSKELLKGWKELIGDDPPGDAQWRTHLIYEKNSINDLNWTDENMWENTKKYYNDTQTPRLMDGTILKTEGSTDNGCTGNISENDRQCPPITGIETPPWKIINNAATLGKYSDTKKWICPIPSIIDAQSVCNKIPVDTPAERHSPRHHDDEGYPLDYNVTIKEDNDDREFVIKIERDDDTNKYKMEFELKRRASPAAPLPTETIFKNDVTYDTNPKILSAINIVKNFIDEKCIDPDGELRSLDFYINTDKKHEIMGIFSRKLMGDFTQELYAITKSTRDNPLLFIANDRVSSARYLLLKQYARIQDGEEENRAILLPGGGGYLSYSNGVNNYFILMGPDPMSVGGTLSGDTHLLTMNKKKYSKKKHSKKKHSKNKYNKRYDIK